MKPVRISLPNRIKTFLYYYFRCFKPKIDPNLSDYADDYNEDYVENYVEDYSDSEIVTLIHLNNK
jgi:hypothetical protein